jgi:hypothetical protein
LLYEVVRYWPKRFDVIDLDGSILEVPPVAVLYRLPELLAADATETVNYVEGEKDVERLRREGLIATTNPGGCKMGFRPHYATWLKGRHVVVLPDADNPGRRLAEAVVAGVRSRAASVVIAPLPRLRGGQDVSDWLDSGHGTVERLTDLVRQARYVAAGLTGRPNGRGRIDLVLNTRLDTLAKLILVVLIGESQHVTSSTIGVHVDRVRVTAANLGVLCSCHRVTAQRVLTQLRRLGVLRPARDGPRGDVLAWEILAAIAGSGGPTA